jgi:hypothetical protein
MYIPSLREFIQIIRPRTRLLCSLGTSFLLLEGYFCVSVIVIVFVSVSSFVIDSVLIVLVAIVFCFVFVGMLTAVRCSETSRA